MKRISGTTIQEDVHTTTTIHYKRTELQYRTFSDQIRGYIPQDICFRKQDGKLALTNQENCEELAECFSNLLNCPELSIRFTKEVCAITNPDSLPTIQGEIKNHIKNQKIIGHQEKMSLLLL